MRGRGLSCTPEPYISTSGSKLVLNLPFRSVVFCPRRATIHDKDHKTRMSGLRDRLVLLGGVSPKAVAQNGGGVCVVLKTNWTYYCYSGCVKGVCTCSSQTTLTQPNGGTGAGQLYNMVTTQCCGNTNFLPRQP